MKKLFAMVVVATLIVLSGCASAPAQQQYAKYASCTVPVTRDAGMGVRVPGCEAWSFGPSLMQGAAARDRARVVEAHK